MSEVRVKENESLESALKRFKRQCARAGVMAEVRKREHYEKPSVKRKKKAEAARKRRYYFCGLKQRFAVIRQARRKRLADGKPSAGRFFYWRCVPKK